MRLPAERSFPSAVLGPRERAPLAREDRIRTREDAAAIIWLQRSSSFFGNEGVFLYIVGISGVISGNVALLKTGQ